MLKLSLKKWSKLISQVKELETTELSIFISRVTLTIANFFYKKFNLCLSKEIQETKLVIEIQYNTKQMKHRISNKMRAVCRKMKVSKTEF